MEKQQLLQEILAVVKEHIGEDTVEESYINELDYGIPYITVNRNQWLEVAQILYRHDHLQYNYLRNLSGVDQETHIEVVYHLTSMSLHHDICIKVKLDREDPVAPSVTFIWATANWNEREAYDLLGIQFENHPDLRRIMMPDDWVGYPLRKDYVPIDPEV